MKKYRGLFIAGTILVLWFLSLITLLSVSLEKFPYIIPFGILVQTFLYTGIFITAHDAMHGIIVPGHFKMNSWVGTFCLLVYALFPYNKVRTKHYEHHHHVASAKDPDYHNGINTGFWRWYVRFMFNYMSLPQVIGMAILFHVLLYLVAASILNLVLFWVLPALLSSLQLFYFGTYLPHREPAGGYDNVHRSTSNDFSTLVSFLTCYHFGYHWEHHEYPNTPWWQLPLRRS